MATSFYSGPEPPKTHHPLIHVTDKIPHIVWTTKYEFVILELMDDDTLLVFTQMADVIKIKKSEHSKPDFKFKNHLKDRYGYKIDPHMHYRQITAPDEELLGLPGIGSNINQHTPYDLLTEFDFACKRTGTSRPPVKVFPRTKEDDPPTPYENYFTFWNFDMPSVDFYLAWYHSSNTFPLNYQPVFYSYCLDITVPRKIGSLHSPEEPAIVTMPKPHMCGLNANLYAYKTDLSKQVFCCPPTKPVTGLPANIDLQNLGLDQQKCKIYYSYQAEPWDKSLPVEYVFKNLRHIIDFRNKVWNNQTYRCRLDHDNKLARFWHEKPMEDRMIKVRNYPETINNPHQMSQMKDAQIFSKIITRVTTTWSTDDGKHMLKDFQDCKPGDHAYVDLDKLPYLPYKVIDDMDARGRGFLFYYKHCNTIIYRNIFAANLYAIGNLYTNTYIDVINNGLEITHAWKRYRQPIRLHARGELNDKRPLLENLEDDRHSTEYIPFTNEEVDPPKKLSKKEQKVPKEWTPIFMPCHAIDCKVPDIKYKLGIGKMQYKKQFSGYKRKYTVSKEHLDTLIKHIMPNKCTKTNETFWKSARDGPVPIYFCGNILDDRNCINIRQFQEIVLNKRRFTDTLSLITFSPMLGLCDFTKNQVRLPDEPDFRPTEPLCDATTLKVPVWTCSPRCVAPPAFSNLSVDNNLEYQQWLINLCLNSDKIKFQLTKPTNETCTVNPEAAWHMYENNNHVAFFCTNYSVFGVSYHLPLHHPKRWTLAYMFTQSDLHEIPWTNYKNQQVFYMPDAVMSRPSSFAAWYRITRYHTGEWCEFSTLRFGIGTPIFDEAPDYNVIYEPHEVDIEIPIKILQFIKHIRPDKHDLESVSMNAISLNKAFSQHAEEQLIAQVTGMSLEPTSDEYLKAKNEIIQKIALGINPTADLRKPEPPPKTPEEIEAERLEKKDLSKTTFVKTTNKNRFFNVYSKK